MAVTSVTVMILESLTAFALAAETTHRHSPSPKMGSQHTVMSLMMEQWQAVKKHLEAGAFNAAAESLSRMQAAVENLTSFKPHRNAKRMEDFKEYSDDFKKQLSLLSQRITEKDKPLADGIVKGVDTQCLHCHRVFR